MIVYAKGFVQGCTGLRGAVFYEAIATVMFSHVKISSFFARKLTWYFFGVYIIISFSSQERDDLEDSDSQPKKYHYFWDPYETTFVSSATAYTVDKYARISFPVTFALLNSIYWIVYAPDKVIF